MARISVYLNFDGTTEAAFKFYQSIFGGELNRMQRFDGVPGMENLSPELREKIMHVELPIGSNLLLHATDALEAMGHPLTTGNNFHLMIEAESKAEADGLFQALSAGGKVEMPLEDVFWGAYYGQLTDKFGVQWMVNYDYPA